MAAPCPTINSDGEHLVNWARNIFGACVYNARGQASVIFGLVSIACFAFVQFPQIWTNFKLKQLPGLSRIFIVLWLLGDTSNLIGCILSHQLATQLYQAIYFMCVNCVVVSQIIWIYCRNKRKRRNLVVINDIIEGDDDIDDIEAQRGTRLYSILPIFLVPGLVQSSGSLVFGLVPGLGSSGEIIGYVIGWVSATCYISSRFPQIRKNYMRKSTTGLSLWMFCCTTAGNTLYSISLFLMFVSWDAVILHLPWLLGSVIPLGLDMIILSQFFRYRNYQRLDSEPGS